MNLHFRIVIQIVNYCFIFDRKVVFYILLFKNLHEIFRNIILITQIHNISKLFIIIQKYVRSTQFIYLFLMINFC